MNLEQSRSQTPDNPSETPGDRLLKKLGADPSVWTTGDRRIALVGIGTGLVIMIVVVCGYTFGLEWTGITERTFWDWLKLLIVPAVLALGGYLFTRSESRRAQKIANEQRDLDRYLADQRTKEDRKIAQDRADTDRDMADQRRQDEVLQAYLSEVGQLVIDNGELLEKPDEGERLRTLVRARTLTVLKGLDANRKTSLLLFLYEAALIGTEVPQIPEDIRTVADIEAFFRRMEESGPPTRIILPHISLEKADLTGVDLTDAFLSATDLSGTNMNGAILRGADLDENTQLNETQLNDAHLTDAHAHGTSFRMANLASANLDDAFLVECDLGGATLTRASLHTTTLTKSNLSWVDLTEADLTGAFLTEANLEGVKLAKAKLSMASLERSDLTGVDDLAEADLAGAFLTEANLEGVKLAKAKLSFAMLEKTNLTGADLTEADLRGANLREADLTDANLSKANLYVARGLTEEQLATCRSLEGATMRDGLKYEDWIKSKGSGEYGQDSGSS